MQHTWSGRSVRSVLCTSSDMLRWWFLPSASKPTCINEYVTIQFVSVCLCIIYQCFLSLCTTSEPVKQLYVLRLCPETVTVNYYYSSISEMHSIQCWIQLSKKYRSALKLCIVFIVQISPLTLCNWMGNKRFHIVVKLEWLKVHLKVDSLIIHRVAQCDLHDE